MISPSFPHSAAGASAAAGGHRGPAPIPRDLCVVFPQCVCADHAANVCFPSPRNLCESMELEMRVTNLGGGGQNREKRINMI